jgi:hypothetical protein
VGRALVLAILVFAAPAALSGQTLVVLHIRAVLSDAAGRTMPVPRHALLISDNPPSREPRRVVTTIDGTAIVRLRPGNYTVESDEPIAFQGQSYRWNQTLDVPAGRETTLELTSANATAEALAPDASSAGTPAATDVSFALRRWLDSVVKVWTPTAHASGFLIDAAGLIATNQKAVGDATAVEVQLSRSLKVAGTVVEADRERDVAVIRIDPSVMASSTPVPLGCPRPEPLSIARGQEIYVLAAPLRQDKSWTFATVSRTTARAIASDLTLATGGTGGPVFTAAGELAGITTLPNAREEPRRGAAGVVRIEQACDAVAAAIKKVKDAAPPGAAPLPVEPLDPAPVAAFKEAIKRRAGSLKPYQLAAADFDVAFLPPLLAYAAQSDAAQDFRNWSDYVADIPPVLFVRVTPKMAESLWAKMARGAAMTQGMALPAFKRLGSGFRQLRAFCGRTEVTPIHPFKLELRVSETEAIYEGLYAFDPAALGPACESVSLTLYSEKEPDKGDTRAVDPTLLEQIRRDLAVGAPSP